MADLTINSTAGSQGSSGANRLMRFIATQFIRSARNRGGPTRFITDVSDAVANRGNIVAVPVAPNVTSRLLTDGSASVLDDDTGSTVNVTLNRHRYSKFSMTSVERALDGDTSNEMLVRSRVDSILNGLEEDLLSIATSSFTTNTAVGTYNSAITEANFATCVQTLLDQRAPGPLTALIRSGTNAWGALSQIANFANAQVTGAATGVMADENYGNGRIFHSCRCFLTQALPKSGTSIDNLMFDRSAIAMAIRPLPLPSAGANAMNVTDPETGITFQLLQQWDGSRFADEIAVRFLYGYSVVKDAYGIQFKS